MKLIHCYKDGCYKNVPEHIYLSKWKALGYKIVEDTSNGVSSNNLPKDYSSLSFLELKKIAKEKGINTYKMKQEDIINALNAKGE